MVALAKHPLVDQYDMSTVEQVFSGAAPLSAELALEAGARLGCEVVRVWDDRDVARVAPDHPGGFKPGSVGVTAPSTATRIVDPESGGTSTLTLTARFGFAGHRSCRGI